METYNKIGNVKSRKLSETEIMILVAIVGMYGGLLLAVLGMIIK